MHGSFYFVPFVLLILCPQSHLSVHYPPNPLDLSLLDHIWFLHPSKPSSHSLTHAFFLCSYHMANVGAECPSEDDQVVRKLIEEHSHIVRCKGSNQRAEHVQENV